MNIKVPRTPENTVPKDELQHMLYQAVAFFQAGSRCNADLQLSPNVTNSLSAPAAVCYALAIEVYFKLLLKSRGVTPPNKHDFIELYKLIPDGLKEVLLKRAKHTEPEFIAIVTPLSDTFVRWRYLYEADAAWTSISTLAWLGQLLHNTIRVVEPDLRVAYEADLPAWAAE